MVAWWTNRIDVDRNNDGVLHPVGKYVEELLPERESNKALRRAQDREG
jgi:hypothetical protein